MTTIEALFIVDPLFQPDNSPGMGSLAKATFKKSLGHKTT